MTATLVASEKLAIINCPCTKRNCPRHGACEECREYHLRARHPRPPYCERKPGWFKRWFGAGLRAR